MATWTLYTTPKGEPMQKFVTFRTKTEMMNYANMVKWDIVKEGPYKYTYRLKNPVSILPKGVPKDRYIGAPKDGKHRPPTQREKNIKARVWAGKRNAQVKKVRKITKTKQLLKKASRR